MRMLRNIYYSIDWFFCVYIPKLFDYAKMLWRDIDFEYEYLLPIIALKTKYVRKYLVEENVVNVDEKRMKEVELLCDRIFHNKYLTEDIEELNSRYPHEDIVNGFFDHKKHPLADDYWHERHIIHERAVRIWEQDKDRLFYLLRQNLNRWWS